MKHFVEHGGKQLAFDDRNIFTVVTSGDAVDQVGKRGFLGDTVPALKDNIRIALDCVLEDIASQAEPYPFIGSRPGGTATASGSLFLPVDCVHDAEFTRPYTLDEFVRTHEIGSVLKIRSVGATGNVLHMYKLLFIGYGAVSASGDATVYLGPFSFSLAELCAWEELDTGFGNWIPMSVRDCNNAHD